MSVTDPDPRAPAELLRVEVSVPLPADAAFAAFVEGMAGWWPEGTSLRAEGAPDDVTAVLEPGCEPSGVHRYTYPLVAS